VCSVTLAIELQKVKTNTAFVDDLQQTVDVHSKIAYPITDDCQLLSLVHASNNVEATFEFVEMTIFYDKLVLHCCWCGRGFTYDN